MPKITANRCSVSAVSANDVWAVGWYQDSSGNGDTLIEHWNGSAWTVVPSPGAGPNGQEGSLSSVAAVSASDVWAVGGGLVEHWDGSAWTMVSSPNPSPYGAATLFGVAAVSANDIWAAGWYEDSAGGKDGTLVERWDGSAWTVVLSPNPSSLQNFLFSTAVVSASDVWAVGSYGVATNGYETLFPLIEHWDGSSWNVVPSPNP